jgi:formate hydrogenlyase transcriptional activator
MRSLDLHSVPPIDSAQQSEWVEDLLRFARSLDAYSDPERLLCSLPDELCSVFRSNTTALIHINGDYVSWYAVDSKRSAISAQLEMSQWQDEIFQLLAEHPEPIVFSSLDQELRFPGIVGFFSRYGNQSLCIFPLNKVPGPSGALCFASWLLQRRDWPSFPYREQCRFGY